MSLSFIPYVIFIHSSSQGADRGPSRRLPQADGLVVVAGVVQVVVEAAHLRGDRVGAVRVPADGEAVHAAHHDQDQQHPRGPGDPQAVRQSGELLVGALCCNLGCDDIRIS